ERRLELRARTVVLARVAVRAADEDVGLRYRPGFHDAREEPLGGVDFLQPEVLGGEHERRLRVKGRVRTRRVQLLHRLLDLPPGRQGLREETARLRVTGLLPRQSPQDLDGLGR